MKADKLLSIFDTSHHSADLQTALVRSCWSELFTLGLAQCSSTMCLPTMLAAILNHLQASLQRGGKGTFCGLFGLGLTTIKCFSSVEFRII